MKPGSQLPQSQGLHWLFRKMIHFYSKELLAPRPTPTLQDHPLSAVRECLFNIYAATLHIGGRSSIRNLRTLNAVVTGTHLSRTAFLTFIIKSFLKHFYVLIKENESRTHETKESKRRGR